MNIPPNHPNIGKCVCATQAEFLHTLSVLSSNTNGRCFAYLTGPIDYFCTVQYEQDYSLLTYFDFPFHIICSPSVIIHRIVQFLKSHRRFLDISNDAQLEHLKNRLTHWEVPKRFPKAEIKISATTQNLIKLSVVKIENLQLDIFIDNYASISLPVIIDDYEVKNASK